MEGRHAKGVNRTSWFRARALRAGMLIFVAGVPLVAACSGVISDPCQEGDPTCLALVSGQPDAQPSDAADANPSVDSSNAFDAGLLDDAAADAASATDSSSPDSAPADAGPADTGPISSLPQYPYCYCINHPYAEGEVVLRADGSKLMINGDQVVAHYTRGILWATGQGSFKPGHWLNSGGWEERCGRRFSECDPSDGSCNGNPPLPPVSRQYGNGELICNNPQQGWIYAKVTADGRKYACRTYDNNFANCGYVPGSWANSQCGVSEADAQQFDLDDPNLYSVCR